MPKSIDMNPMLQRLKEEPEQLRHAIADQLTEKQFARLLDHTILDPRATDKQVCTHVEKAIEYGMNICVDNNRAPTVRGKLAHYGRSPTVAAVLHFPHGNDCSDIRTSAATIMNGWANEIDPVGYAGYLFSPEADGIEGNFCYANDVRASVENFNGLVKFIINSWALQTEDKIKTAAGIVAEVSLSYGKVPIMVKNSTGFPYGQKDDGTPYTSVDVAATLEHIAWIREEVGQYDTLSNPVGIKAAGGIRHVNHVLDFIAASGITNLEGKLSVPADQLYVAFRAGTSSGPKIMEEFKAQYKQ